MPEAPHPKVQARRAERRARRRSLWTIVLAIVLSLGVHLALLPLPRSWFFADGPVEKPPMMVDLQPPPRPKPRPPQPRPPRPPQGPIVDAPPTKDTHVPADARFRSEHDTHVKKETVARNPGTGQLAAVPTPSNGKGRPHPASKASKKQAAKARTKAAAKKKVAQKTDGAKKGSRSAAASKHTLPVNDGNRLLAMNKPKPRKADKPPEKTPAPKHAPDPALMPDLEQMANAVGGARADQMPGVQMGTQTWLNSRQFKYASFWNRIRSLAGQAWEPIVRDTMRVNDPAGHHLGGHPRVSVVAVTLDEQGQVDEVHIARSSGSEYLDAAAVGAFRDVGRFPNPPPPLVSPDGHIRFEFAFILNFTPPSVAGP